jgi:Na+-translocating ferredoxin:NAD+ oxidoreductase RnfG subunit
MRDFDSRLWVPLALACAAAPVQATQYLTVDQAQHALFPEADSFAATPVRLTAELRSQLQADGAGRVRGNEQPAWAANLRGAVVGHILVDEVIGKHELITYAVGIGSDGAVRGVEILDYRETRGGEVRDPRWRAQFVGKRQGSRLRLDDDIQNLSGATLSCRHVTEGVRRLVALHARALKGR